MYPAVTLHQINTNNHTNNTRMVFIQNEREARSETRNNSIGSNLTDYLEGQSQDNESQESFNGVLNGERGLGGGGRRGGGRSAGHSLGISNVNTDGGRVPRGGSRTRTDDALSITSTRVTSGLSAAVVSLLVNNDSSANGGRGT